MSFLNPEFNTSVRDALHNIANEFISANNTMVVIRAFHNDPKLRQKFDGLAQDLSDAMVQYETTHARGHWNTVEERDHAQKLLGVSLDMIITLETQVLGRNSTETLTEWSSDIHNNQNVLLDFTFPQTYRDIISMSRKAQEVFDNISGIASSQQEELVNSDHSNSIS